ncbi:MAG: pantoate--beta-alanine ligase [Caulobacterales bacterium]|nr:pantoate--beta-alanine ligase [Caulobacterales bacterium]
MQVVSTIAEVRAARPAFAQLGFVPTMGFLHEGHLSLIRRAKAACGAAAVSIFVNPTQFAPHEDLARYPRNLPRDLELAEAAGADLVFTPTPEEMYPPGFSTFIDPGLAHGAENAARPGHFRGVATVVAKLFGIMQPTLAVFGQKDAEQCVVIRKLVRDLDLPVTLDIAPTAREADGLAMSSRNSYLTPDQRAAAVVLIRALRAAEAVFAGGERDPEALRRTVLDILVQEPLGEVDYVALADLNSLEPLTAPAEAALLSLAVRFGHTRLIDNAILGAI